MDLTGEVKLNIRVVLALRIQEPFALGQVHQVPILIRSNIATLEAGEIIQLFGIGTGDPAGFVIRLRPEFTGSAIFLQQAVLDHLKLELSHTTNDLLIAAKLGE